MFSLHAKQVVREQIVQESDGDDEIGFASSGLSSGDDDEANSAQNEDVEPKCCDRIRARRVWYGLRCFGCIPDPLRPLQTIGVDATRHYGPCGRRCLCCAMILALLCLSYIIFAHATKIHHVLGLSPVVTLIPWIFVFLISGIYLSMLVCASSAGTRIIMAAICRTDGDPDRPKRVKAAYKKIGDLDKDLSRLDPNSCFAIQQLMKSRVDVVKEALERGFNVDFSERLRGDDESQRFMLGACILTHDDPSSLNRGLRVYTDPKGNVHVYDNSFVPPTESFQCHTIDEMLRYSGFKEEIALSLALLPTVDAAAVLLRWAMGHSYEAKVGLNCAWIKQGLGKALDAVNEVDAVRLLLILPCAQRREVVSAYDRMTGGDGSFLSHVQSLRMSEDYRVALLCLISDYAETRDSVSESLQNALTRESRAEIIRLLCYANDQGLSALKSADKEAVLSLFGVEVDKRIEEYATPASTALPADSSTGTMPLPVGETLADALRSRSISVNDEGLLPATIGAPTIGRQESSLVVEPGPGGIVPYWLRERWGQTRQSILQRTVCGVPMAEQFEAVFSVEKDLERGARRATTRLRDMVIDEYEHIQEEMMGPSSAGLVRMLLECCRATGLAGESFLGEYYKEEIRTCMRRKDVMGMLALLVPLDDEQRGQLVENDTYTIESEEAEEEELRTSLPALVCKCNWKLMELVVLGHLMPAEFVWARTLYEACYGGITGFGLGTDEETLTTVLVLNWHQRAKLRDALLLVCKWKGRNTSIETMIDNEIENVNFKMLLLNLIHT